MKKENVFILIIISIIIILIISYLINKKKTSKISNLEQSSVDYLQINNTINDIGEDVYQLLDKSGSVIIETTDMSTIRYYLNHPEYDPAIPTIIEEIAIE